MGYIQAQLDFRIKRHFVPSRRKLSEYQGMLPTSSPTGQTIRAALKRLGKTQAWLAEKCDVSNNAVSLWIKKGEISREKAAQVAQLLGVPVGALVSDEDPLSAMLGEAIFSLGEEEFRSTIDFLLYNLQRTMAIYDGEKAAKYADMIERLRADMKRRQDKKGHE